MSKRKVMQLALNTFKYGCPLGYEKIIGLLEAELAKPTRKPKPVVWMQSTHLDKFEQHACGADSMLARCSHRQLQPDYVPLYSKEEL